MSAGAGQHLVQIHDHLRAELEQVVDLVGQVEAGALPPEAARSAINETTMRQNNWTLGAYCAAYCRVLTTHHTIEDQSMFTHLARAEPALEPVVARLREEHEVIHGLLEDLDRALVALVGGGEVAGVRRAVEAVREDLLTHLAYEEEQLVEPLSRVGFF